MTSPAGITNNIGFFWKIGSEKIEIKSELTSYDKILYSFPVVDFLES